MTIMMKSILTLLLISYAYLSLGQSYTSYFTGDTTNVNTNPIGGTCLMGGNTENDEAMKWFLQRADGCRWW